jgi:hypothetical protein
MNKLGWFLTGHYSMGLIIGIGFSIFNRTYEFIPVFLGLCSLGLLVNLWCYKEKVKAKTPRRGR